jgi:archaemetzincin
MSTRRQLLCALLALLPQAARGDASGRRRLYIQPLGRELPDADVSLVLTALRELYGLEVRMLARCDLPAAAYYAPGKRYRADVLLDFLAPLLPVDGLRILGLTGVDISTTKGKVYDWGVLGLGSLDGASGVLSSFRCHKRASSAQHARERLAKVAVHETGHTLGLDHCPRRGCLMEDADGTVLTTDREYDLCPRCRKLLLAAGHAIPEHPSLPWPKPAR